LGAILYQAYQMQMDALAPWRAAAEWTNTVFKDAYLGPIVNQTLRRAAAGAELLARAKLVHRRPDFGIRSIELVGGSVGVSEEVAFRTPFGSVLHFRKDGNFVLPRVLLVAPMAGHFATLLRQTVRTLLPEHDVYVTDWHNARDVAASCGRFGLDEYVEHLVAFLEHLGPGAHIIAVCQPCVAVLAATALMAEDDNPVLPRSVTLMAGPIDTRISPTKVNELATSYPIEWFERNLISAVPIRHGGAGRRVYPGFMQLLAFISMNMTRHARAHLDLFSSAARGDEKKAQAVRDFYDEYFAVLDLPAEFYLETVNRVFQEHRLPKGTLTWRHRKIDPRAIRQTALLTVEGERDDICAPGQTVAAHELCTSVNPLKKHHHLQPGAGHYGVFAGGKWQTQIYPEIRNLILRNAL
jgi:polyhydroxyalkanoate depolymerase